MPPRTQQQLPSVQHKQLEALIKARTELNDVGVELAKKIPSIVVIGDQSTGKSSLLSALTGLQLPTGDGTVTRAPLRVFIRPGQEYVATLSYRVYSTDGKHISRTEQLTAGDLQRTPGLLGRSITAAQEAIKNSLVELRNAGHPAEQHILGNLNDTYWLLRDEIELTVDKPHQSGTFTVVDLPGLHRPLGHSGFTEELNHFIKDKISHDNVIILNVMTAEIAVAAGETNLSHAFNLAYEVDREFDRTLTILTKADTPNDHFKTLKAAISRSRRHGCVLVATDPKGGRATYCQDKENDALEPYQNPEGEHQGEWSRTLEEARDLYGVGFGVDHLFEKLVKLQDNILKQINIHEFQRKLQDEIAKVDEKLLKFQHLPGTDDDAKDFIDNILRQVERQFRDACKNAAFSQTGEAATGNMIRSINEAANSYTDKQSSFIPGILGKKKVLDIILDCAHQDEKVNHPDMLSEYTAIKLFSEFHTDVNGDARVYVDAVYTAVRTALESLLQAYLCDYPKLVNAAISAAHELLHEFHVPLMKAVSDLVDAYTCVVEPLHDQVLYMTYQRLLTLASGILVAELDRDHAKALLPKEGNTGNHKQQEPGNDLMRLHDQGHGLPDGTSNQAAVVGAGAQIVAKLLLGAVIGPFADPVGASIGVLAEKAWQLFMELLLKYKANYLHKKAAVKRALAAATPYYKPEDFRDELVPLPWPEQADPMTSFELMCKMMNCDPGYVVVALEFYYRAFDNAIKKAGKGRKYGPVELQRQFIACLCRMLCTHHAMTESVAKLVRMKLLSTEDAERSSQSLPNVLGIELLKRVRKSAAGANSLKSLVVDEQILLEVDNLKKKRAGVQAALQHLQEAWNSN